MDLKNNLEAAIVAARKAGEFLIKNKNQKKKVLVEQGRDIKIELDRECENLIRDELKSTQIEIYGEELQKTYQQYKKLQKEKQKLEKLLKK